MLKFKNNVKFGGGNPLKLLSLAFGRFNFSAAGFTLAEVLITLGIIGVVAAITMPNLMSHLTKQKLKSQFFKAYAELNRAARAFYAYEDIPFKDYQDTLYSGTWNSTASLHKFMSYYKGATDSNLTPSVFDRNNNIINLNLAGLTTGQYPCDQSVIYTDMVGRLYSLDDMAAVYGFDFGPKICIDTNGIDKPNRWGYDRFVFVFTETNAVVPYKGSAWNTLTRQLTDDEEIAKYCSYQTSGVTHTCAHFALNDKKSGRGRKLLV